MSRTLGSEGRNYHQWRLVARQNKQEIPRDKDEVNKREIHEYDGRAHDPDTMVALITPPSQGQELFFPFLFFVFCFFQFNTIFCKSWQTPMARPPPTYSFSIHNKQHGPGTDVSFNAQSQSSDIPGTSSYEVFSLYSGFLQDQSKTPDIYLLSFRTSTEEVLFSFNTQDQGHDDPYTDRQVLSRLLTKHNITSFHFQLVSQDSDQELMDLIK